MVLLLQRTENLDHQVFDSWQHSNVITVLPRLLRTVCNKYVPKEIINILNLRRQVEEEA